MSKPRGHTHSKSSYFHFPVHFPINNNLFEKRQGCHPKIFTNSIGNPNLALILINNMVWSSAVRWGLAKRVPMIKFRSGAAGHGNDNHVIAAIVGGSQKAGNTVRIHHHILDQRTNRLCSTHKMPIPNAYVITVYFSQRESRPTIEDWQLPRRYWRKEIDDKEIEYINRGGPE